MSDVHPGRGLFTGVVFLFPHLGSVGGTEVIRFGGKCLYLVSLFSGPKSLPGLNVAGKQSRVFDKEKQNSTLCD